MALPNYEKNYNEIKEMITYSTEETKIGTWINGKTIYRKVVTASINSGLNTVSINVDFDDIWIDLGKSFIKNSTRITSLARADYRSENYSVGAVIDIPGKQFYVITGTDSSLVGTAYITIEYTKN